MVLIFSLGISSISEVVGLGCSRGNALVDNFISLQTIGAVWASTLSSGQGGAGPSLDISLVGGFVGPDLCGRADEVGEALVGGLLGWAALVGGFLGGAALLPLAGRVSTW